MDKKFACSQCEKQFKLKRSLNTHQLKIHGIPIRVIHRPFACAYCEKKYTLNHILNKHQIKIHGISCEVKQKLFSCFTCNKTFSLRKTLRYHEANKHGISQEVQTYKCEICDDIFEKKMRLLKHVRENHRQRKIVKKNSRLLCPVKCCTELFLSCKRLRDHIALIHKYSLEMQQLVFGNVQEFYEWKEQYENKTKAHYVMTSQKKIRKDGVVTHHYYCHRSFNKRQLDNGKFRRASYKIGRCCPSTIFMIEQANRVFVNLCHTHIGHTCDIKTIPLSKKDKRLIANKLSNGVPAQRILQEVRSSIGEDGIKRIHLLKRKDIYNIKKQFSIERPAKPHEDDTTSLTVWLDDVTGVYSVQQMIFIPNTRITDSGESNVNLFDNENHKELNAVTSVSDPDDDVTKSNAEKVKGMTQLILGLNEHTELSDETSDKITKHLNSAISLMNNEGKQSNFSADSNETKACNRHRFRSTARKKCSAENCTEHESAITHELLDDNTSVLNLIPNNDVEHNYDVIVLLNTEQIN